MGDQERARRLAGGQEGDSEEAWIIRGTCSEEVRG